jgi:hypothetical protein
MNTEQLETDPYARPMNTEPPRFKLTFTLPFTLAGAAVAVDFVGEVMAAAVASAAGARALTVAAFTKALQRSMMFRDTTRKVLSSSSDFLGLEERV